MERKNYIVVVFLLGCFLSVASNVFSQIDSTDRLYEAYARGKMDVWYEVMIDLEGKNENTTVKSKLELVELYYGYTAWLISVEKNELAESYIEKSEKVLKEILDKEPSNATAMAFKGAFIAFEISLSNLKAIYLGRISMDLIEEAIVIDANNVQANIELANANYYAPSAFGGDKEMSIVYYKKAAAEMEENDLVKKNWMYLYVMTTLGMAYEATDQIQKAKLCYEKILLVKPNFMWVGEELYPDMIKRHNL